MNVEKIFCGTQVTPAQLLMRREARADRQRELLGSGCTSLVSFTLNIPGACKQFPMAKYAFAEGLEQLRFFLQGEILQEESVELVTGSEAFLALRLPAPKAKEIALSIEILHPLGRLFDIDVLDSDGRALSRTQSALPRRRCLICGQDAKVCGRTRAHTPEQLQQRIAELLCSHMRDQAAAQCSVQATRALLTEVSATPKPGLVDRCNPGAHRDMDFFTFVDSSTALSPWFVQMFCAGWDHSEADAPQLFGLLRLIGRRAEAAMMAATGGINTQKGLIFSLGLLCGAMGALHARAFAPPSLKDVLALCSELGRCACGDFAGSTDTTNGLQCYRAHQITGIRGEAANGFPAAAAIGLPSLQALLAEGRSLNDAAALTLLRLVARVEDTNMIKRGGLQTAQQCRIQAENLLADALQAPDLTALSELDRQYIRDNLSPGGCADLLSLSLMLHFSLSEQLMKP